MNLDNELMYQFFSFFWGLILGFGFLIFIYKIVVKILRSFQ